MKTRAGRAGSSRRAGCMVRRLRNPARTRADIRPARLDSRSTRPFGARQHRAIHPDRDQVDPAETRASRERRRGAERVVRGAGDLSDGDATQLTTRNAQFWPEKDSEKPAAQGAGHCRADRPAAQGGQAVRGAGAGALVRRAPMLAHQGSDTSATQPQHDHPAAIPGSDAYQLGTSCVCAGQIAPDSSLPLHPRRSAKQHASSRSTTPRASCGRATARGSSLSSSAPSSSGRGTSCSSARARPRAWAWSRG